MSNAVAEVKTEILHTSSEGVGLLQEFGWEILCDGHGDVKLTGGVWMHKGCKEIAHQMQQVRWREIKARSDKYYAQCWV